MKRLRQSLRTAALPPESPLTVLRRHVDAEPTPFLVRFPNLANSAGNGDTGREQLEILADLILDNYCGWNEP